MARSNKNTKAAKNKNKQNTQKKKTVADKKKEKKQPSAAEVLKKSNKLDKELKLTVPANLNGKVEEGSLVKITNKIGITGIYEVKNIVLNLKKNQIACFMSLDLEEVNKDG